jgi:nicotinamide mononucleotide transporter
MNQVFEWIFANWFELSAAALGLFSIYFQIKQNAFYWPISIVMVSMYIFVYYNSKFYADMSLQFYYLGVSFYGWYYWIKGAKNNSQSKVKVTSLDKKTSFLASAISIFFFAIIYFLLKCFTDSDVPFGDAFTTALSFVATWLLARKILENWIFWIVVDFVSTGLYIYKGLYATAVLFFVLTILAFIGYYKWKKSMNYE